MSIDSHSVEVTRRRFLQFGGAGALSLGGLVQARLRAEQAGIAVPSAIRSCIFIFYYGGPSHLDTYDPKPNAPSTVRGEFQPISTSVPGLQISEHLPHMAGVMHHCALIRSMHHTNRLHDSASIETHTGRQAAQGDREEFAPIPQAFRYAMVGRGRALIEASGRSLPGPDHKRESELTNRKKAASELPCCGNCGRRFGHLRTCPNHKNNKAR